MDKHIRLPKDGFIDDKDIDGSGLLPTDDDVEGHGLGKPDDFTVLPPPPSFGLDRSPGHGGELHDSGEDKS